MPPPQPEPPSSGPPTAAPSSNDQRDKAPIAPETNAPPPARVKEIGGPPGPEPTRYGDWQFNGRVTDF